MRQTHDPFDMTGRVVIITGGAGLLGKRHAGAMARAGATPVLVDIRADRVDAAASEIRTELGGDCLGVCCDITDAEAVRRLLESVLQRYGRVDVLINNAANNPTVGQSAPQTEWTRLENFPLAAWHLDIAVGLTGAFLCSQIIGAEMARRGSGVIINVASDLAVIAPDQRLYER